ncbi:MAG: membrane protein insertase YidC [Acidobacteriota bacterium]|nr:membrane protein insertase YidC [Acidobacteriota bacterium]
MADNLPNQPGSPGKFSMEARLLVALLLMVGIFTITPYFYKPPAGPTPTTTPPSAKQATQMTQQPAAAPTPSKPVVPATGQISASADQSFTVETDLYRIQFSNRGAVVKSWQLKKFVDDQHKPLELVNPASIGKVPPPFALDFHDKKPSTDPNMALFTVKPAPGNLGVDFEFSDGQAAFRKSFRFLQNSYLSSVTTEASQNGTPLPHLIAWRGGFGDVTVQAAASFRHTIYYQSKLIAKDAKSAKDGPFRESGNYIFAGIEDKYFAAVVLPKDNISTQVVTYNDGVSPKPGEGEVPEVGAGVGGESTNTFSLFVGPKDLDILRKVDPKLEQIIDWGFFGVIAKPLFIVLSWLSVNWVHNYGWSIVLITVFINLLLLPLRFSSLKSARKMQSLQPQIQAINAKYKNVGLRDPRKAEQNAEVMELYKKAGANPFGGCLPMLVQLPVLYAFYKVLTVTIELRGGHWLWVSDLSQPEQLPLHFLPIIMIVTQFIMQKMTPNPSMDPAQAKMMQFMPLMFGFFFYNMSSGLVLYWLTGNLVGILQQSLMNRLTPAPPPPAPPQKALKKKS